MVGCEMKRFSRVLVTGGAGFVGSHFVDGLLAERFEVCALGNTERLEAEIERFRFGIEPLCRTERLRHSGNPHILQSTIRRKETEG